MDQIIGTITLPLFLLFAFCVMLGIKPNVITKPLLSMAGSVAAGVLSTIFSICALAFKSGLGTGSTISKPQPRFRPRSKFTD